MMAIWWWAAGGFHSCESRAASLELNPEFSDHSLGTFQPYLVAALGIQQTFGFVPHPTVAHVGL